MKFDDKNAAPSSRLDARTVEEAIERCERTLAELERTGDSDALDGLRDRLANARRELAALRAPANPALSDDLVARLATWAGNRDPVAEPRRLPPLSLGDSRRR